MARDMSDAEIMKMELEQLQKEVKTTREPVSISRVVISYTVVLFSWNVWHVKKTFSDTDPPISVHFACI